MSALQPPLNPSKLSSGIWAEWWLASGKTGRGEYYWDAPSVDIDGRSLTYDDNHGAWQDSNGGYQGWWWSNSTDLTYKGVNYDGQSIAVIDADGNSIYDPTIDYIVGYAFGWDSGGTSGNWDRTSDYDGIFSGGSFGVFKITVAMDYSGTNGDDIALGSTKKDTLRGNKGNDKLYGYDSNDLLYGGTGNDNIYGGIGNDRLVGGNGNDHLVGGNGIDTAVFSSRNNRINLGSTSIQNTRDGNDILTGIENINGGGGNDIITGNSSANKLNGGHGNDTLYGGLGNDRLVGGGGIDTAVFSSRNNRINLGSTSRQNTRDGNDILIGIENVNGGGGNDIITGNRSANKLNGGNGNDTLYGGLGNDRLVGGGGIDTLTGGIGNDILKGGRGNDIFQINSGVGRDVISDYTSGDDRIKLLGGITENDLTFSYVGGHTRIKHDDDLLAIVQNTIADDITFI